MTGGYAPARKGARAERELVHQLCELAPSCARVPLFGAIGAHSGDIDIELHGRIAKIQIKARHQFRTPRQWLGLHELLILKADRCDPLVVMPIRLFAELARGRS
jgi:hypothetical protein